MCLPYFARFSRRPSSCSDDAVAASRLPALPARRVSFQLVGGQVGLGGPDIVVDVDFAAYGRRMSRFIDL